MDQVIAIATILLLLAIVIRSGLKGIQSLISLVLLGLLVTVLFANLPGRGMSFAFGLFGGGDDTEDAPITAMKAFDEFSQASRSFVPNLISSGLGTNNGTNGTASGNGTDVTPTNPGNGASGNAGSTGNTGSTGTDGTGSNGTGTGNVTGNNGSQGTSGESGSTGSVRAWW